jgi:hypothetical protein
LRFERDLTPIAREFATRDVQYKLLEPIAHDRLCLALSSHF